MNVKSMLWNAPKPPPCAPKPAELLFESLRGHDRFRCELRDHGEYGIEAQILRQGELVIGRRFDRRALAVQWAEEEQRVLERGEP